MKRRHLYWTILLTAAIGIKLFSLFPAAVERYYSNGLYPAISRVQRILFGWLPISVGDLLYAIAGIYLLITLIRLIRKLVKRQTGKQYWKRGLIRVAHALLWLYISFNFLWGLNYNRLGIAYQLNISNKTISSEEINALMRTLATRVNHYDSIGRINRNSLAAPKYLFKEATASYQNMPRSNGYMNYKAASIKTSLYSYMGNYMGYTGYYNPFTGEAQVNTTVPLMIQPFTACHEIGHQLGYAKENEANFAGYLSAKCSTNPAFLYSVYFELYSYGRPYLYYTDSASLKALDQTLHPDVKRDFREVKEFYRSHENPVEKIIDKLYGQYLKANEQPAGKVTYGQVILWLVAYYRVHGAEGI